MNPVRSMARWMIAWVFIDSGLDVLLKPEPRARVAGPALDRLRKAVSFLPADDIVLVRANAAGQLAAGTLLAAGKLQRLPALFLAVSLIPTTFGAHPFWTMSDETQRAQQRTHFNKNLAIIGGLLFAGFERPRPLKALRRRSGLRPWK
jgi:uncharacterized membrane protein YphA (DoxX/SURF4 family)